MSKKKKTDAPVDEAQQQEEARRAAIRDFNAKNYGEFWIDPDRIPTEQDVMDAKHDFEAAAEALKNRTYLIADAANSVRVATFLKNFVATCFWTREFWRGVLNLTAHLNEFLADVEKNGNKDLVFEYGPLQFTHLILENYAGIGIEAADAFAKMWDEYVPIHDVIMDHVTWFEAADKQCNKLRDRWSMLSQGYYLVILEHEEAAAPEDVEKVVTESEKAPEAGGTTDAEKTE